MEIYESTELTGINDMGELGRGNIEGNLKEIGQDSSWDNAEGRKRLSELFLDDFESPETYGDFNTFSEPIDSKDLFTKLFADDYVDAGSVIESREDAEQKPDYDENGTRELTEDERQILKDKLGWSDKKIEDSCRIDENGVIHYKTDCQDKEGQTADCGVRYERKIFEYNGIKIEGVFPVFDSVFDTELDKSDYQSSNGRQFSECNRKLKEAIGKDPELRKQFTEEQLADIENGNTPRGYTWHHSEEPGKMQLVKTEDHDKRIGGAAHTGGNSIWGNKSIDKTEESGAKIREIKMKGETF